MFKTGFLVTDLEGAMRDFARWLGVTWTPVQQSKLVLDVAGAGREEVELRYAYTTGAPPYLELLEAQPRGYYAAAGPHLHHVGRWVDDLAAASRELAAAGFLLEAAGVDANGRSPAVFAFHRGGHGLRLELVDRAMQPTFESWLAGGTLELP